MTPPQPDAQGNDTSAAAAPEVPVGGMIRRAVFWSSLNFIVSQGAGIVIFLIIAAKVPPHVFGVVALAAVAADFVSLDGRFAAMDAIIQSDRFDQTALNSAFASFLALVGLIAAGLVLSAPAVSTAYHEPLLAAFTPLFALMLLPIPWIAVMDAQMMKDLRYRQTAERSIAATLISGVIGVAVTFTPFLIWALLIQRFVSIVIQTGLLYQRTRWLPRLSFQLSMATAFVRRFLALWFVNTLVVSIGRVTLFVFGLRYNVVTVGLLRATNRITDAVQSPMITPLMGLWFPLMAKVRGDIKGEQSVYNSIVRAATLVALPAFAGLTIVAPDLVGIALPPAYAGVTPILQASSFTMLLIPVLWFNNVAFGSMSMNRMSIGYTIALVSLSFLALVLSKGFSAPEAILLMSIPAALVGVAGTLILNHRLQQSNISFYAQLLPAALAAAAMSVATLALRPFMASWPTFLRLFGCASIGAGVYVGWLMLFHRAWLMECVSLLIARGGKSTGEPAALAAAN